MKNKVKFKALQDKWYKKLSDSGFHDIEYSDGSLESGVPSTISKRLDDPNYVEAVQAYYRMASTFLNEHQFKNDTEKLMWSYFSEGMTLREIATALGKIGPKIHHSVVDHRLKKLEKIMKAQYLYE